MTLRSSFLLVLVLLTSAAVAGAATISYDCAGIASAKTDWSTSLECQAFNPSYGTLTSVTLTIAGTYSTVLTVTNTGTSGSSGKARTEVTVTVLDPDSSTSLLALDTIFPSTAYTYTLAAGGSVTSGTLSGGGTTSSTVTTASILSEFTGTGDIYLPISTFTETVLSNNGGNTSASQITYAAMAATVTYTYTETETPEPTSMVLMGSVLLGFGLWRRHKRA